MNEIELKLQVDAASAEGLGASNALPEQRRTVQQRDLYFDTADRALAEDGLSLRIQQSGSYRTQTIKRSGSSAAGHRGRPGSASAVGRGQEKGSDRGRS